MALHVIFTYSPVVLKIFNKKLFEKVKESDRFYECLLSSFRQDTFFSSDFQLGISGFNQF